MFSNSKQFRIIGEGEGEGEEKKKKEVIYFFYLLYSIIEVKALRDRVVFL